ncbi:hypothetical protein [Roseobacter sp. MH60115]|uniref:hypothetical protein n=1 Tax=Roseobacter sp. MH60115 TaxID=2785324 RepID=UPI0018A2F8A0|nr:hypothetical protein [Roseobacter sp. MH60115]
MPNNTKEFLLELTEVVANDVIFKRAQLIFRNLPITDRALPDLIQDLLRDLDGDGVELWKPKEFVPYPLIDNVWAGDERYLRKFLALDRCKYPERDKFLFLFLKIRYPNLYRHLIR